MFYRRMVWKSYILGYPWWKIFLQRCSFWCVKECVKTVSSLFVYESRIHWNHIFGSVVYNIWDLLFSRGQQTWGTAVVFGSCLWAGRTQSTGTARWGWWVWQTVEMLHTFIYLISFLVHVLLIFLVSLRMPLLPLSDDFPESTGVKRIIQALNANVWSSVQMKDGAMTPVQSHIPPVFWLFNVSVNMYVFILYDCLYLFARTQSRLWSDE